EGNGMQAGREIKFQVYDQESKEMWSWEDIIEAESAMFITLLDILRHDQFIKRQYTGLRDKNGKEIYEGDVWLLQGSDTPRVIVWHRYGWWFQYPGSAVTKPVEWTEDGEIIGNIYENPELLEVGNDASRT
ncbi:YopX family protein, partial [Brevibacillus borstelensis]